MSSTIKDESRDHDFEKSSETEQIENAQPIAAPAGFGTKAKRHCLRWWWAHLIIFCLSFLIIALCLVYVGMPHIAQHDINRSSLRITNLQFLNPTRDTVTMVQKTILHNPSIFTPTLDPFNASLFSVTNGTIATAPLTQLLLPKIHARHPNSNITINQTVILSNLDEISSYSIQILSQKNVSTILTGKTKLHEGHLPVNHVHLNKTLTYAGLNGLAGFNLTGAKLNLTAATGEPNLSGFAYIPNPSLITIELGNVTLSISTAAAGVVGNCTLSNALIVPGDNSLPMTAIIDQAKILASKDSDGFVDTVIKGMSVVYNGQNIPYFEAAFASNALSLRLNVLQILADSTGL